MARRLVPVIAILLVLAGVRAHAENVTVFAAASLTNVFEEVGRIYRERSGKAVRFSFASTSTLAKQIEAGAPAHIFASADEKWMDWATDRKLIVPETRTTLLANQLVLITPRDRSIDVDIKKGFELAAVLGRQGRLAMGDPDHVPAGRYAKEALTNLGAWGSIASRVVRADNVRVALALVERSEVPAGIVYATDAAVAPRVRVAGVFPASSHTPIVYPIAIVRGQDSPDVRAFFDFLRSESARASYQKFGFRAVE